MGKFNAKKLKIIKGLVYVMIFVVSLLASSFYIFSFFGVLNRFELISDLNLIRIPLICGFIISVFVVIITKYRRNHPDKSKFGNFILLNYPKLVEFYCLSSICFYCIKTELIFDIKEAKELISLEWSIFGISITIFLVWNVVILQHLKNKKPTPNSTITLFQKLNLIEQKTEFYQNILETFSAITYLGCNLLFLVLATAFVYLFKELYGIAIQNIVITSLFFCTNSIVLLFSDIIKPLVEEKKALLRESKISYPQIIEKIEIEEEIMQTYLFMERIEKLDTIDKPQKDAIKKEMFEKIYGKDFFSIKGDDKKDDQL